MCKALRKLAVVIGNEVGNVDVAVVLFYQHILAYLVAMEG